MTQTLHVKNFPLGPLQTNSYCIYNTTQAVIIDAGGAPDPMLAFLQEQNLTVQAILCTHLHFDHTYGIAALHSATGAPVYASNKDEYLLENEFGKGGTSGFPLVSPYSYTTIEEQDMPLLGGVCKVLATPGHTEGGLSFYFADAHCVFAGDTLFYRSVGRSDFPRGNQTILEESIRSKLFCLPEATRVFAGHGPSSNIGEEKRNNPYVSDFKA